MTASSTASLAFTALLRNRLRSLLTMLGVVIGVGAVLMMQATGEGATAYIGDTISAMGSNLLMVIPGSPRRQMGGGMTAPLFTTADVDAIRRRAHDLDQLAAVTTRPMRLVAGVNNRIVNVGGVSPEFLTIREWSVADGRTLTREDERQAAQVCVLGKTVRDALFPGAPALGQELRVHDLSCRVVGVLEAKGSSAFGMDQDDVMYLPFSTFSRRILGSERVAFMMAKAPSTDRIDDLKQQLETIMRERRRIMPGDEDDFAVRDPRELQAVLDQVTGVLTTFLLGVAGISLLVGGIGIMNIMLVSVTERTREIGVRLAVGARPGDILSQFLVEAIALSAAGGILGIVFGLAGAVALSRGIHVPFVFPASAIPVAVGVSLLVGVVFGVFPARKAARLNPLAALRFE